MLGAAVFFLRANCNGTLPDFTGRIMHGVFFKTISNVSADLAGYIHDELTVKPFSISELIMLHKTKKGRGSYHITKGDVFKWRIAALNKSLMQAIIRIPLGYQFQVNKIPMVLEKIVVDDKAEDRTGFIDEQELLAACCSMENISEIKVKFLSPTTFRVDKSDYPLPIPKLFFASLAEKWQQTEMPTIINTDYVRELSKKIYPIDWNGKTSKTFLSGSRGVKTFMGEFVYDISALSIEDRQIVLLLARFGSFSGCGRLTGQGLGQIKIAVE